MRIVIMSRNGAEPLCKKGDKFFCYFPNSKTQAVCPIPFTNIYNESLKSPHGYKK